MTDKFTRPERRIAILLLVVTAAGAGWNTIEELRPPPPPVRLVQGAVRSDSSGTFDLNGSEEGIVYSSEKQELTGPINLMVADEETLIRLPGIGPVLARRIIEWRTLQAGSWQVDDLLAVAGIGPVKLDLLRPFATIAVSAPDSMVTAVPDRSGRGGKWR
ncbi:ComEA family DNA-binding protein [Candidatus Zixiibacteriota bacterium]